ncbi:hypothetical protein ABKV19_003744 [Rosa sericea]
MGTELPSSSFASSSNTQWTYDVFLSFRGEDTRKSFTDHLYAALDREGIFTFRDDEELDRGQPISSNLLEAIRVSRITLVVISRNYASSTWCLDELTMIVECMEDRGQRVFPIFYDVDPCEVRKQTGWFGQAFVVHEERFKDDLEKDKVQKWRAALTRVANLSGFHLRDRYESKFIQEITGKIVNELSGTIQHPHSDDLGLVGIDFGVEEIMKLCSATDQGNDVVFVGVWGMGGVGKTTLAQAFYDKISDQFRDKCFLKNVREISRRDGIVALTKDLLCNVLKRMDVYDSEIRHRFRRKKVLIILDDVDKLEQLQALAGSNNWFGRGSRIIITTRDIQLLIAHHVDRFYKVKELKSDDGLKLFSWKAFKNDQPPKDYIELSRNFVNYSKGLPLAIEVLGSFLCGQSLQEWESAFSRIQENLDKDIMSALRISFDGLHEKEKQIFLDIACFFKGQDRDKVTILLEGFGFDPIIGISALIRKSLITIVGSKLWMHDLLQEMGWELVRGECHNEPGNRSRLWQPADVLDLLKYHKGSDAVQGIVLSLPQEQKEELKRDALSNMKKLRFLKISDVLLPLGLDYLSTELRALEWHGYPSKLLPRAFPSGKLVHLNLCGSHIKHLWKGFKCLDKLKSIDLKDSASLIETPDFTGVPNLETLILEGCTKLSKVHPSICNLRRLRLLNMKNCKSLRITSWDISLESLEIFNLSGCARLKRFPEIVGDMKCLSKIYLDGSAIEELPLSIERLTGLTLLDMAHCKNILRIPSVISSLTRLKTIILSGCSNLIEIPENIGNVECLEELDISGTAIRQMPSSIVYLRNLKVLSCSGCSGQVATSLLFPCLPEACPGPNLLLPASLSGFSSLMSLNLSYCNLFDGALPNYLDCMSSLMELKLRGNKFTSIPESICRLSKLVRLELDGCILLQSLPKLPSNINSVRANGCMSLKSDSDQYEVFRSKNRKLVRIYKRTTSSTCSIRMSNSQFAAWLNRYHEVNEVQVEISLPVRTAYGLSIRRRGNIPEWFNNRSSNFSITIPLSKDLINNSRLWMGCAFYVGLEVDENFDTGSDFKVRHKFDCCFDTMEGPGYKQTLYHEVNAKGVHLTESIGYWIIIPHLWFSARLNAFNQCGRIEANTTIDSPCVEVKMSGARLLYEKKDFRRFVQAIKRAIRPSRIRQNNSCCVSLLAEDGSSKIDSSISLKEHLSSLPSDLKCYEGRGKAGFKNYIIEGKVFHAQTSSLLGEILQIYSGQHAVFYRETFPQYGIPEWFCSVNGSSAAFPLNPMNGWKGIAACAVFTVLDSFDPEKTRIRCSLETGFRSITISGRITKSLISLKVRGYVCMFYASRGSLSDVMSNDYTSDIKALFYSTSKDITVHSCGYQIVSHENMEEFMETMLHFQSHLRLLK